LNNGFAGGHQSDIAKRILLIDLPKSVNNHLSLFTAPAPFNVIYSYLTTDAGIWAA